MTRPRTTSEVTVTGDGTPHAAPPEPATAIGVDVGASRLKLALVDRSGAVMSSAVLPTPQGDTGTEVGERIAGEIAEFRDRVRGAGPEPAGIGVVVPYFVEGPDWVQRFTTNLPALEGLALRPILDRRLGGELRTGNDVSAAVIAEHLFGRGMGVDRLLLMAIGTGISVGVIVHGELLQYSWGTAGDTGHLVVDTEGLRSCTCGGRGCLETVAAGWGLQEEAIRLARHAQKGILAAQIETGRPITTADVAGAARQGDAAAGRAFKRAAFFLGAALASYLQLFSPQLIVLSGGVMESRDLLLDGIRQSLQQVASPARLSMLEGIEVSAFPQMGAAIGSASLILFPDVYLRSPSPMEAQPT